DEGIVTPDALTDLGARQDFSAAANQQFENAERLRRQLDAVAMFSELAGAGIELKGVETKDSGRFTHRKLMWRSGRVHGCAAAHCCTTDPISVPQVSDGR